MQRCAGSAERHPERSRSLGHAVTLALIVPRADLAAPGCAGPTLAAPHSPTGRPGQARQRARPPRRADPRLGQGTGHRLRDVGLPVPLLPRLRDSTPSRRSTRSTSPPARCAGRSSTFRSRASTATPLAAAEVALCAAQQNAFWRVHDLLYQHQDVWAPLKEPAAFFLTLADSAKISRPTLLACVQSPATREALRPEAQGAAALGRQQHADVLHRGRPAGRCAAAADLPAGAGFDHPGGEDAGGRRPKAQPVASP